MRAPTIGEGKALLATMLQLAEPEDLIGYLVIGMTEDGPRIAHSLASPDSWGMVDVLAEIIRTIAAAEMPGEV